MGYVVRDCMTTRIRSVDPDMSATEALRFLVRTGTSGLPVIDKEGNVAGIFTEKEILKAILPGYLKDVGSFVYGQDSKAELRKIAHLGSFTVRDLMRTEVPTLDENASLSEASHIMLTRNERRIMVMKGGKPVGIITRSDVVTALAKEAGVEL